ncbi:MAG: UpxY family transcription antiterminator [Bacteroidales bacterium]|nr:UpxY family transcription antiterminator [Bacteroidales bacterium]
MLSDVPQWVALYTSARAEKKVSARLNQMGIETYIPTQRRLHKWSDRMKWVEVPLLPSYLFARINIRQEYKVRYVDGLAWSIKFDGHTATIPDSEMQAMMDMVNSDKEVYVKNLSELRQGVQVRVIAGSFAGQEGYIYKDKEKKGKGKDRFGVSIDVLGKVFVVDLDEDVLEVIETKKETPRKKYNI